MSLEVLADRADGVRVLRVDGELDAAVAPALLEAVPSYVAGAGGVVLDLSEVTFFDSAGCRLVDALARTAAGAEVVLRVVAPPGCRARRVLELTGLAEPLVDDELAVAVAAAAR